MCVILYTPQNPGKEVPETLAHGSAMLIFREKYTVTSGLNFLQWFSVSTSGNAVRLKSQSWTVLRSKHRILF